MALDTIYPTGPIEKFIHQVTALQQFRKKHERRFEELTEREKEILSLIADGMNNPSIADKLDISRATVQNHRARVRDKLNINSQTGYIKYALAYDLIEF